jgi:hypothetical protein
MNGDMVVLQHTHIILDSHATQHDIFIPQELHEELWHCISTAYLEDKTLVCHRKLKGSDVLPLLVWKILLLNFP